tara:strand:+ start:21696 stop:22385 length:690 start_codon:yes stop_codon:yes gene_type:complete
MPLFKIRNQQVAFVHLPKTGGSSIEHWLEERAESTLLLSKFPAQSMKTTPQHISISDIQLLANRKQFDVAFAIVRNPFRRLESEFRYRMHLNETSDEEAVYFSPWVLKTLHQYNKNAWVYDNHIRPQHEFLDKTVKVFKFEDGLLNVANAVSNALNIESPEQLPHEKNSSKVPLFWTKEAIEATSEFYQRDIEVFGYEGFTNCDKNKTAKAPTLKHFINVKLNRWTLNE